VCARLQADEKRFGGGEALLELRRHWCIFSSPCSIRSDPSSFHSLSSSLAIGAENPRFGLQFALIDNANRLLQIAQGTSGVRFNYDSDSRPTSLTLPNGFTMSYGYDAASQLSAINYQLGNTTLGNLTYSYDLAGRRTSVRVVLRKQTYRLH
jgi:YD repeat-containing protein